MEQFTAEELLGTIADAIHISKAMGMKWAVKLLESASNVAEVEAKELEEANAEGLSYREECEQDHSCRHIKDATAMRKERG